MGNILRADYTAQAGEVRVPAPPSEIGHAWDVHTWLRKYDGDWTSEQLAAGLAGDPREGVESDGNMLLTAGILVMLGLLSGAAVTAFSTANARIGVGDASTAAAATQTDLLAATNKVRVGMDAGYPKVGVAGGLLDNQIAFQATFGSGVAEWGTGWQEWGIFNAASAGTMLNRKAENKGIKGALQTWQFLCLIAIT
jgi:hypothetical protein